MNKYNVDHFLSKIAFTFLMGLFLSLQGFTQTTDFPSTPLDVTKNETPLTIEKVYLDKDSTRNHYTAIYPTSKKWKGYILLVPGFGESAERVMQQTALPLDLARQNILTILPSLQDGTLSFGIDSASQASLRRIIDHIRLAYDVDGQPFYMGGFSIGGSCVLKYAEDTEKKPIAIFAIDPPIDFEQLYRSSKRSVRLSYSGEGNEENHFLIRKIAEVMQGTPENAIERYHQMSPYSFTDTTQSAIKKLLHTPIRIYTEPDIQWWMRERSDDYTSMNSTYHSAMINELNMLGNKKAELIITENKGYRQPNLARHPHSWSIADNRELIHWLLQNR